MATPTVYVICDQNCKFEGMTKEQILTAIVQAVQTGEIKDVDAGFITTIKTINGLPLRFFVGEQSAYESLTDEEKNNLYAIITNDTGLADILEALETLKEDVKGLNGKLFKTPVLSTTKKLDTAGFYYISISGVGVTGLMDGTQHPLGVVYWDGKTPLISFIKLAQEAYVTINDSGSVSVNMKDYSDGTFEDVTEQSEIYISKVYG